MCVKVFALCTEHAVFLQQASEVIHDGVYEHTLARCPDTRTVCVRVPEPDEQRQFFRTVDGHHVG